MQMVNKDKEKKDEAVLYKIECISQEGEHHIEMGCVTRVNFMHVTLSYLKLSGNSYYG